MYNRLKYLYEIQKIDNQLDDLEELRGDLPNAVKDLENKIESIRLEAESKEKQKMEALDKRQKNEAEVEKLKENQKKFKAQLYAVRNNKEYDALTKEIDHSESQISKSEAENDSLADLSKKLTEEIEELTPLLTELADELKIKQKELKEIISSNQKEESKLLEERKKIEAQIKKPDYSAYIRIRKAKKGKAVVTIKRSACTGCHNIVPAQRQLEIRRNNKIFFCEYCGRILVSHEISESDE